MRRRCGLLSPLLLVLVALVATPRSFGQGTDGMIPDPMGIREARSILERYAVLQKVQWPIVERIHDEYLAAYTALRDGPVQRFLDDMASVNAASTGQMPEHKAIKRMFDEGVRINRRIAAVDDAFFQKLISQLAESQVPGILRAKTARRRTRNSSGQFSLMVASGTRPVDEAYWELDLPPETRAMIDPDLLTYENAMATLTAKRLEEASRSILNMTETFVEAGYGDITSEDMQDPEKMQEFMVVVQEAMATSMAKLAEVQTAIDDRNLSFARRLRQSLSLEDGHKLMRRWVATGALIGLTGGDQDLIPSIVARSVKGGELSDSQTEALEATLQNWRRRDIARLDELAEATNALTMLAYTGGMMDPEGMGGAYEGLMEINEARRKADERVLEQIKAIIGPDQYELIATAAKGSSGQPSDGVFADSNGVMVISGATGGAGISTSTSSFIAGPSGDVVPDALPQSALSLVAELLALSQTEHDIVKAIHAAYLENWKRQVDEPAQAAQRISQWTMDEDSDAPQYDAEALAKKWNGLGVAMARSKTLDDTFFDDIGAILSDDGRADRLLAARQYRAFQRIENSGGGGSMFTSATSLRVPNPYLLATELDLEDETRSLLIERLVASHAALGPAIDGLEEQQFRSAKKIAESERSMFAMTDAHAGDGDAVASVGIDFEATIGSEQKQRRDVVRRAAIVRRVMAGELTRDLDELIQLELLVVLLDQMAGTKNSGLDTAQRIRRMQDLTKAQSAALESVLRDHLTADSVLAVELLDLYGEEPKEAGDFQSSMQFQMAQQGKIKRVTFRRTELEVRLLDRIGAILTPVQRARIPALVSRSTK